jgi:hypothetical protein
MVMRMPALLTIVLTIRSVLGSPSDPYADLITQLGADTFEARKAAEDRLVEAGFDAMPHLLQAAQSPHPETALRSRRAAVRIVGEGFEAVREIRASGGPVPDAPELPGWSEWLSVAGEDSADSRRLYAQIFQAQDALLESMLKVRLAESLGGGLGDQAGSAFVAAAD